MMNLCSEFDNDDNLFYRFKKYLKKEINSSTYSKIESFFEDAFPEVDNYNGYLPGEIVDSAFSNINSGFPKNKKKVYAE